MNYTKGPWIIEKKENCRHMIKSGIFDVANINGSQCQNADATLIAAAPDLYEALKAIMDAVDMGDELEHMLDCDDAERCAYCQAKAAIKKAEGE